MSEYKPCNIDLLAKAIYRKQSDYVGSDHAGYCVSELKTVLQSFETKIAEDADALEQAQKDRDFWKRRADQRQIDIDELKRNPAAPLPAEDSE